MYIVDTHAVYTCVCVCVCVCVDLNAESKLRLFMDKKKLMSISDYFLLVQSYMQFEINEYYIIMIDEALFEQESSP